MSQLPNSNEELEQSLNTKPQENPVVYTGEMIANMTEEELAQHSDAIEAQFNQLSSEEDYQAVLQGSNADHQNQEPTVDVQPTAAEVPADEQAPTQTNAPLEPTNYTDAEFRAKLTSTFKASGREVSFQDPDDMIRLMQQGFDYRKKMGEFKPQKRIIKTLEQHGLLDEAKLNHLIELAQGKPEAIAQYLKEHQVDTYALPNVEEQPYQAADHLLPTNQVEFQERVQELQGSTSGQQVLQLLNGLNDSDFAKVYNNQQILTDLQFHADSGLMADALSQLEADLALGKVPADMSYLDAYNAISGDIYKRNLAKYNPNQPRVVGNNLQPVQQTQPQAQPKHLAGIPANQQQTQVVKPQLSEAELQRIIANTPAEEFDKYPSWEAFIAAQQQVKFR